MKTSQNAAPTAVHYILFVIILILATILITACGSKPAEEGASGNTTATPEVTVTPGDTTPATVPSETPAAEPTKAVTPSAEPTKAVTPTAEPTKAVTPTAVPTTVPAADLTSYGDLTKYLDRPAAELIAALGTDPGYEYWENDYYTGTTGGLNFGDDNLTFCLADSAERLDSSCKVHLITAVNPAGKPAANVNLGNGLNLNMKYAELKSVMGDALLGPFLSGEGDGFYAYGIFGGVRYYFSWHINPENIDFPAGSVMITKSGLDWLVRNLVNQLMENYAEDEADKLLADETLYRNDLRTAFRDVPVGKLVPLTTIRVDEHITAELYEIAAFGYASTWKETETGDPEYLGIDRAKELYSYDILVKLVKDGRYVETIRRNEPGYHEDDIAFGSVTWASGENAFEREICRMAGLSYKPTDAVLIGAATENWVHNSLAITTRATYNIGDAAPIIVSREFTIHSNDGGSFGEHYYLADGSELVIDGLQKVKEGTGFLSKDIAEWPFDDKKVSWTLLKTESGEQVIHLTTDDFGESSHFASVYYLYTPYGLIQFGYDFEV